MKKLILLFILCQSIFSTEIVYYARKEGWKETAAGQRYFTRTMHVLDEQARIEWVEHLEQFYRDCAIELTKRKRGHGIYFYDPEDEVKKEHDITNEVIFDMDIKHRQYLRNELQGR